MRIDLMHDLADHRDRLALAAAVLLPVGLSAALVPFRTTLPSTIAVLLLVTVVVAVAANGDRVAGLAAAASAAVWFDFFLTRPYERLTITRAVDIETTVLLLVVGAAVTELAVHRRRRGEVVVNETSYLDAIRSTAELVASGSSPSAVVGQVCDQLTTLLDLRACRFERGQFGGLPVLQPDGQLRWGEAVWDVGTNGMPEEPVELRAACNGQGYGRFIMAFQLGATPSVLLRQTAAVLAQEAATAFTAEWTSRAQSHDSFSLN